MSSGLMAGKRSMDGNNAAFDMKSLGKHIEAVGFFSFDFPTYGNLLISILPPVTRFHLTARTLPSGKRWKRHSSDHLLHPTLGSFGRLSRT
jgi:hypothetical protein